MAAADAIAELDRQFGIPGVAQVVAGNGGLPCVRITSPTAAGEMYLHGAHVTSWKPQGADEVLFVSSRSRFEDGRAIRGGVPICFPWFADRASDPKSPPHGLVRAKVWQLDSISESGGAVTVAMHTESDETTKRWWPGDFRLVCRATFGTELAIELAVENTGASVLHFEEALHTYFRVGDINAVRLRGLDSIRYLDKTDANREKTQQGDLAIVSETDRIYLNSAGTVELVDPVLNRRIEAAKQNSLTTVIWNPWIKKSQAMSDFGDSEWTETVCIETCNVADFAVELAPGKRHTMKATVRVAKFS